VSNTATGEVVERQNIRAQEEWAIPLPPGTYSLAAFNGEGKRIECESYPASFTVAAGEVAEDSVGCDIP
jgi:hypothetical protein